MSQAMQPGYSHDESHHKNFSITIKDCLNSWVSLRHFAVNLME